MPKKIKDGKSPTAGSSSSSASEEQKESSARDEIDAIFASVGKKRKKPHDVKDNKLEKKKNKKKESIVKDSSKRVSKISGSGSKSIPKKNDNSSKNENRDRGPRKRTGDGLAIYAEEELGFGNPDAGGTRLCPFDCDCCF